jgi:hypothetical protein
VQLELQVYEQEALPNEVHVELREMVHRILDRLIGDRHLSQLEWRLIRQEIEQCIDTTLIARQFRDLRLDEQTRQQVLDGVADLMERS